MSELSDRLYLKLMKMDAAHDALLALEDRDTDKAFRDARRVYRHAFNAMVDEIEAIERGAQTGAQCPENAPYRDLQNKLSTNCGPLDNVEISENR